MKKHKTHAFTLIELSIVLVIIGLIVGGVLAGQALIKASELQAVISQVDQFKIATNTFKNKYGALPGDMHPSQTAKLGFFTFTGSYAGTDSTGVHYGNNDGLIYGTTHEYCGVECGAFWRHLSDAGMLAGGLGATLQPDTDAGGVGAPAEENQTTPYTLSKYMPTAKSGFGFFGAGSLLYYSNMQDIPGIDVRKNIFFVVPAAKAERDSYTEPSMSGMNTFGIDAKIDDGKPNTGRFIAYTYDYYDAGDYIYWSATVDASSNVCTYGGSSNALAVDVQYNLNPATGGDKKTCIPLFLW